MTGGQLLQDLLRRPHLSELGEFEQFCSQDLDLDFMLGQHRSSVEQFFCDGDMQPKDFWAFVSRNPWLLSLASSNGEVNKITWSQLLQSFPEDKRIALSLKLIPETFLFSVEHFIWFFFAKGYANLEIDISPPAKKTVVKEKIRRIKTKKLAAKIPEPDKQKADLIRYRRAQMAMQKPGRAKSSSKGGLRFGDPSLDKYLEEISRTPLISRDEELKLTKRMKQGDKDAQNKLVKAHLRFVVSVAKQYQWQGMPLADLINDGNIGMIKAAKRFDWTLGFRFISYAIWWIRQAILQSLAEQSRAVRLPLNRVGRLYKIGQATDRLLQSLGRHPTPEEIAAVLELSEEEVSTTLKVGRTALSLNQSFTDSHGETDNTLLDVLEDHSQPSPDQPMLDNTLRRDIAKALDTLTSRQAEVITLYFGLGSDNDMTLEQIGARFSLTRERIRQIKEKAITRLRHVSRSRALRAYFDTPDQEPVSPF